MSTARLFLEALDTLRSVGWALRVWIVLMAVAVTLALYTVVVTVASAVRTLWRGVAWAAAALRARSTAPVSAEQPASDSSPAIPAERRPAPHVPSWAQPDEEAA